MDPVRFQYEAFPYPARDPAEEARRLIVGSPSHLAEIDHHLHAGGRDWSQPFRALVAGGGTGDGLVMLAQHLADAGCPAEILYLDLSTASREIAAARIAKRGLRSVRFESGSLLAADRFGRFDYIDCCGVLHHLPDPAEGLAALAAALAPGGGIGLMLYGAVGRRGVYDLQALLRRLAPPDQAPAVRLATARRLLAALPATNWFRLNRALGDHRRGDAELFDLLLHAQDQAFDVPGLKALIAKAGLALAGFVPAARYAPETYLADAAIEAQFRDLNLWERAEMAELLAGNLKTHVLYLRASESPAAVARLDAAATPVFREPIAGPLADAVARSGQLAGSFDGLAVRLPMAAEAPAIIRAVDGRRRVDEIAAATGTPSAAVRATLATLIGLNLVQLSRAFAGG